MYVCVGCRTWVFGSTGVAQSGWKQPEGEWLAWVSFEFKLNYHFNKRVWISLFVYSPTLWLNLVVSRQTALCSLNFCYGIGLFCGCVCDRRPWVYKGILMSSDRLLFHWTAARWAPSSVGPDTHGMMQYMHLGLPFVSRCFLLTSQSGWKPGVQADP